MRRWPITAIAPLVGEASPNPFDRMVNHAAARFFKTLGDPVSELVGKKYTNSILPFQFYIGKLGAKTVILRTERNPFSDITKQNLRMLY